MKVIPESLDMLYVTQISYRLLYRRTAQRPIFRGVPHFKTLLFSNLWKAYVHEILQYVF